MSVEERQHEYMQEREVVSLKKGEDHEAPGVNKMRRNKEEKD